MAIKPWAVVLLLMAAALIGWRLWRGHVRRRPAVGSPRTAPGRLTPEAALDRLSSLSPAGRARLKALLTLEKRIAADVAAGPVSAAQLAGYLTALAEAGDDIEHHVIGATIVVRQGTFNGEIIAGEGDGWHLAGRARDLGQDNDFASTEDLVWSGLSPSGRPGAYILALYAKGA